LTVKKKIIEKKAKTNFNNLMLLYLTKNGSTER
jgi:dihydroorotase